MPAGNRWAALPWKRLAVLAAVVFLIAVVVISAIELIAGRSVSSITGGTDGKDRTSIGGVLDEGDGGRDRKQVETPTEQATTPCSERHRERDGRAHGPHVLGDPLGVGRPQRDGDRHRDGHPDRRAVDRRARDAHGRRDTLSRPISGCGRVPPFVRVAP